MKLTVLFRRIIFFLIIFVAWKISAQELRFDETIYDFGKIKEEAGTVNHDFVFVNTGIKPVRLTNVKAT